MLPPLRPPHRRFTARFRSLLAATALAGLAIAPVVGSGVVSAPRAGAATLSIVSTAASRNSLTTEPANTEPANTEPVTTAAEAAAATPAVTPIADRAVVTVDTVTPTVVRPGDVVTIAGTVTAPTTGPLTSPGVRLVQGSSPLMQRSQVDTWASGVDPATGPRLGSVTLGSVAASQTVPFTLRLPSGAVRSDKPFAALPVSVDVVQPGASTPVGFARTFLAWNARKEYEALRVATVLPVTLDPDVKLFSRDTTVRERAWRSAIGPSSRIRRLIDATAGSATTLAVDPSVFGPDATGPRANAAGRPAGKAPQTPATPPRPDAAPPTPLSTPTSGPPTQLPTASSSTPPPETSTETGTTPPSVAALSAGLVSALAGRSLWALPYADADLAAIADVDPVNPLVRDLIDRSSLVEAAVGHPVRSDIIWPIDGVLTDDREAHLSTLLSGTTVERAAGVVVDQRTITDESSPYTPSARRVATDGTRILGYDARLSSLLPQRTDTAGALTVQRYLAETLVLLGERAGTSRTVLVVAPRTYDPDAAGLAKFVAATSSAPWITPIDATSLVDDSGPDRALPLQQPPAPIAPVAPPPTLTRTRLDLMEEQRETLSHVAGVLRDGQQFDRTYREVLDELASARWRYQPTSWTLLSANVAAETQAATSAIKVVAQSVNFLAEKGTLQITVENGLSYEVADIRLVLAPTNPRMQIVEQPGPISIAPGSKRVVQVPVTAVAAGKADIRAFLTTADGTPIGSPAVIPVAANPIDGTIYWVGGGLVGLVLLGGVVRSILKGTSRIDEISDVDALTERRERGVSGRTP